VEEVMVVVFAILLVQLPPKVEVSIVKFPVDVVLKVFEVEPF
jgi:hypothetical protein